MNYQLVIFDFDGTLADSFGFAVDAFDILADAHGLRRFDRACLDQLRSQDPRTLMAHIGLPAWKLPRVAMHFRQLMAAEIDRIGLFDGVPELLQQLAARGVTLAVVSSNSLDNVRAVLGEEHAALISHYECGASLFGKRRKLRQVLARTGVPAAKVLCIGDEVRDIEAAHGEGLDFGAVTWGYADPATLAARQPAWLFPSVAALLPLLDANAGGQRGVADCP